MYTLATYSHIPKVKRRVWSLEGFLKLADNNVLPIQLITCRETVLQDKSLYTHINRHGAFFLNSTTCLKFKLYNYVWRRNHFEANITRCDATWLQYIKLLHCMVHRHAHSCILVQLYGLIPFGSCSLSHYVYSKQCGKVYILLDKLYCNQHIAT